MLKIIQCFANTAVTSSFLNIHLALYYFQFYWELTHSRSYIFRGPHRIESKHVTDRLLNIMYKEILNTTSIFPGSI
jgi:hypothetical protein